MSKKAVELIKQNPNNIYVSAITAFELGVKVHKKLLEIPKPLTEWFDMAVRLHGIEVISISEMIAIESTQLPVIHRDPADRFIIATAKLGQYTIVTPDRHIKEYPDVNVAW